MPSISLYGGETMARRNSGLNKKEKLFCEYYALQNLSATQAYLKAYECEYGTAKNKGYLVLRRPQVKEYIEALQKEAWEAACINAEKVGLKLAEMAFAAKDDKEYTPSIQLKAMDLLQKQMGLQHQKIEAEVNTDINITIEE